MPMASRVPTKPRNKETKMPGLYLSLSLRRLHKILIVLFVYNNEECLKILSNKILLKKKAIMEQSTMKILQKRPIILYITNKMSG